MQKKEVEKRLFNTTKEGCKLGGDIPSLTPSEQDVLHLLTYEFLTYKQVAIRRKCSQQAVSKIVQQLKKKGVLTIAFQKVVKIQGTSQPYGLTNKEQQIRLHGQEFNIKILYKNHKYKELLNKTNLIDLDGNTIKLYRNSIEIYSGKSFYANDVQKATSRSLDYWNRFFRRLENELKVILIKPRHQNIKLVNQHYAETNNEFAEECEKRADKIRVYTTDDGKLWFTIDNSFNLHEAETQHTKTAKLDMEDVVNPFFNDLRDHNPPTLSELMRIIKKIIEVNKETASGLNAIVTLIKSQIPKKPEDNGIDRKIKPEYIG